MIKNSLDIVVVDDSLEALAARASVEWWGIITRTFFVGKSQDFVDILGGKEKLSPNILLMCHGVEEGIVLPELGGKIAEQQPYNNFLTSDNLAEFLQLDRQAIVSTGCRTGTEKFAQSFLNAGAKAYIAPADYPEGNASLLYILNFYYLLFVKEMTMENAHKKAKSFDSETEMFEMFERDFTG